MNLSTRDSQVIWHPYTQMQDADPAIGIVHGQGSQLIDETGRHYIDAISSWWVNLHGHAHPYIAEKVSAQLKNLAHVIFAGFTHEPAVQLAERLLQHCGPHYARVFYSDNGSTAVEVGLKMALQYFKNQGRSRIKIFALQNSYHGDTFGAMAASSRAGFFLPFEDLLFEVTHLDPYQKPSSLIAACKESLHSSDAGIFIYEPLVQAAGGMRMYPRENLEALLKFFSEEKVLSIADEVMTGFFRTGSMFASNQLSTQPDILCLSKGLTGGTMPLGATICGVTIYNEFLSEDREKMFMHGHSFTANPLACVSALASLDLLEKPQCREAITRIEGSQRSFISEIQSHPRVSNARTCGTICAFDFTTGDQSSYHHPLRDSLYRFFLSKGVLLRPLGNVVYVLPPYCITESELSQVHEAITQALKEI